MTIELRDGSKRFGLGQRQHVIAADGWAAARPWESLPWAL